MLHSGIVDFMQGESGGALTTWALIAQNFYWWEKLTEILGQSKIQQKRENNCLIFWS